MSSRIKQSFRAPAFWLVLTLATGSVFAAPSGAIYTTNKNATIVNANVQYAFATDVYLSGGPQNLNDPGLTDGTYYFQVTDPSGQVLLSTDNAVCRQLLVAGGRVVGSTGPACKHSNGTPNPANGVTPVQLAPFSVTPNNGGEYKAWVVPVGDATISGSDPKVLIFAHNDSKTDNFKVPPSVAPPPGSCAPSSSLSVLVTGTNVAAYVPKGSWSSATTGVAVVSVEGAPVLPATNPIPTANAVNSCASNPVTSQTVCTANTASVYLIPGGTTTPTVTTLTSAGVGLNSFSGGFCTNCGVAMDAVHNRAVIGLHVDGGPPTGGPGFQFLDLATSLFGTAFKSQNTLISEDPLIDPINNQLLSAAENGNYEIIDLAAISSPTLLPSTVFPSAFSENATVGGELDSSGEDCSTRIALAPKEFSTPSIVYIADLKQAVFTAGSPAGTWTATLGVAAQNQSLTGSVLSAGASGIAVAQGTHTGVVTGEFGGSALTAIGLPSTSGAGLPAIGPWETCSITGFSNGFDPHTVTAYQSPTAPNHAIALLANRVGSTATMLAKVDLTAMLTLPTTTTTHVCDATDSATFNSTMVTLIPVP